MAIVFIELSDQAKDDLYQLKKENNKLGFKVWELIIDTLEHPFSGKGKPEPLKGDLSGF